METERVRPAALALAVAFAVASSLFLGGCDDTEGGGVGASIGLPAAFSRGLNEPVDIGVGSVHMVGNPRW